MYSYDVQLLIDSGEIQAGSLEAAEFDAMQRAVDLGVDDPVQIERAGALAQQNFLDQSVVPSEPSMMVSGPALDEFDSPFQGQWGGPFNGQPAPDEFSSPFQSPISINVPSRDDNNGFDFNPFNRGPITDKLFGNIDLQTVLLIMLMTRR